MCVCVCRASRIRTATAILTSRRLLLAWPTLTTRGNLLSSFLPASAALTKSTSASVVHTITDMRILTRTSIRIRPPPDWHPPCSNPPKPLSQQQVCMLSASACALGCGLPDNQGAFAPEEEKETERVPSSKGTTSHPGMSYAAATSSPVLIEGALLLPVLGAMVLT